MNKAGTAVLLVGLALFFIALGEALGDREGMVVGTLVALVLSAVAFWYSDKLLLRSYAAEEITPEHPEHRFYLLSKALAAKAHLPTPRCYVIDSPCANAFATGRDPNHASIAVTSALLRLLNKEETMAVIAHELAHIARRDTLLSSLSAQMAGAVLVLASLFDDAFLLHWRSKQPDSPGALTTYIAPFAASIIQLVSAKSCDYATDSLATTWCDTPLWLVRALTKLERANRSVPMPSSQLKPASAHLFTVGPMRRHPLAHWFARHPLTADRIHRLEALAREQISSQEDD